MNLDPDTLLFALIVTNALTVLSLLVAIGGNRDKRDGMGKWAAAMLFETLTWVLAAARGHVPDDLSIILANTFMASAHAFMLAAICEFQSRTVPRWQYILPIALSAVMAATLSHDLANRYLWSSLIYVFQMVLIGRALVTDPETRVGRAWRLLFAGIVLIVLVLGLRALVALTGSGELAQPEGIVAPHPVQILAFVALMATALLGTVGFVFMVKERTDREILELAMTDSLTQIPNRRALIKQLEFTLAQRSALPMSLLMIDVDHFKRINDTCGHLAGDKILCSVAGLLSHRLRRQDIIGRYGGEEFCVLAPNTDGRGALSLAESLREAVANTPLSTDQGEVEITVSIGYAVCISGSGCDLHDLLLEADTALYAAKQAGRNRVMRLDTDRTGPDIGLSAEDEMLPGAATAAIPSA